MIIIPNIFVLLWKWQHLYLHSTRYQALKLQQHTCKNIKSSWKIIIQYEGINMNQLYIYIYIITLKNNLISSVPAVAGAVQVTVTELFKLPLLWVTYNNRYTVATRYNVLTVDEPPQAINWVPGGRLEKVPIRVELPDWRAWIMRPLNCLLPSSRTTL